MPRRKVTARGAIGARDVLPDIVYNDKVVQKFINCVMKKGKKSVAENAFYEAMKIIESKIKGNPLDVFKKAIENVRPQLEVKSRRVGGATYPVPIEIPSVRKTSLAIRWLIDYAKERPGKSFQEKLSGELMDAFNNSPNSGSIRKRDDTHKMADANKAFALYKW